MKSKRSKGFTLIEVLIAFTILALVLGVVFPTLSSGLSEDEISDAADRAAETDLVRGEDRKADVQDDEGGMVPA